MQGVEQQLVRGSGRRSLLDLCLEGNQILCSRPSRLPGAVAPSLPFPAIQRTS
jgi:hypothetical protein